MAEAYGLSGQIVPLLMLEYANNGDLEPAAVVGVFTSILVIAACRFGLQIGNPR